MNSSAVTCPVCLHWINKPVCKHNRTTQLHRFPQLKANLQNFDKAHQDFAAAFVKLREIEIFVKFNLDRRQFFLFLAALKNVLSFF